MSKDESSHYCSNNLTVNLAVSSIQPFQSNRECFFNKVTLRIYFFLYTTLNYSKTTVKLKTCLTYFFATIWHFFVLLDIFKFYESNYTLGSVRRVC